MRQPILLFSYSLFSFIPMLVMVLVKIPYNFYYALTLVGILLSNGLLIFAMSSNVRKNMPMYEFFVGKPLDHKSRGGVTVMHTTRVQRY